MLAQVVTLLMDVVGVSSSNLYFTARYLLVFTRLCYVLNFISFPFTKKRVVIKGNENCQMHPLGVGVALETSLAFIHAVFLLS
jgi:hypothetical protein